MNLVFLDLKDSIEIGDTLKNPKSRDKLCLRPRRRLRKITK